jgi:hypothetical protein
MKRPIRWVKSEEADWWLYGLYNMIMCAGLGGWIILVADQVR